MKTIHKILFIAVLAIGQACSDNDDHMDPSDGLVQVATVSVPDSEYEIIMYLEEGKSLEVGYNHYYMGLYDADGVWMENAHLSLVPMMTMNESGMMHSVPYEEHEHDHSAHMLQEYGTVFVMPSTAGSWVLNIDVIELDSEFQGVATLPITVDLPEVTKMTSIAHEDGDLFISLVNPEAFEVGSNDLELTIHQRETMMSWPAVKNLTVEIEPEMPAMGHGSPNNENPVHDAMGHYLGTVNFTMTGEWVINVTIKDGENTVVETAFTVNL
ncbi:MAG: FixH family protein [Reichenbachiella sp.]|uniref:FixH family protein n=1 Tax=Reichenbachiella sp. TaxID=2184521 RepID=UPI0032646606